MRKILVAILLQVCITLSLLAQNPVSPAAQDQAPEWELKLGIAPNLSWKYQKAGAYTSKEYTNLEVDGGISIAYIFAKRFSAGIGFSYSSKAGREELLKDTFSVERLAYLDIPVFIHFIVYDKSKVKPFIEAAYVFNTLLNRNAFFIDSGNGKFGSASEPRKDLINNGYKGGTSSFALGIGVYYPISQQFNISLEPYYKFQLHSFLADMQTNDSRFRAIGIQIGASYQF